MAGPTSLQVYCDESSTCSQFLVYGGIVTSAPHAAAFDQEFNAWRESVNMRGELKWVKVSRSKLEHYKAAVDMFFRHALKHRMHFKVVVFNTREIDYRTYHKGNHDLGFYKFYYQFLLHKFGCYATSDDHKLWVYIDQRSGCTDVKLGTLRNVLASGIKRKYGRAADVVRKVEARDSKTCNIMQIADVLMGAVGFHWNQLAGAPGASPSKKALAQYIAISALSFPSLVVQTRQTVKHFEIWRFRFSGPKKKRPSP